eukprot:gnl/MRDRNA2_/MRDRNA2_151746_c0_seq1.p1 gnl/MRDRNA2_/MRDRNA2_151746_c0~~gnl/MRDRNA2_/MRDRNA2_151746_c0_seq1.p1  ORF type:complete len:771 (+),score=171.56 gnl/MRDRNA2_/MRDRNA2_151746_c0_seq1:282-2315(+)
MSAVEYKLYYLSQVKKQVDRDAAESAPRWKEFIKKRGHAQARILDQINRLCPTKPGKINKDSPFNNTFPGASKPGVDADKKADSKAVTNVLPAPPASTPLEVQLKLQLAATAPVPPRPCSQEEMVPPLLIPSGPKSLGPSRSATKQLAQGRSVSPQVNAGSRGRTSSAGSKEESQGKERKGSTASSDTLDATTEDAGGSLQDLPDFNATLQCVDDTPAQNANSAPAVSSSNDGIGTGQLIAIIGESLVPMVSDLPSAEMIGMKQSDIDEAVRLFREFDDDGSGSINTLELRSLLRFLGILPTTRRIYELCKEFDKDDTGELEIEEFLYLVAEIKREEREAIPIVFDKFDKDQSGHISGPQLGDVLRFLGREPTMEQVRQLLNEFDVDGSCSLDLEEFALCVDRFNQMQKQLMDDRAGFEEEEIASFRETFDNWDRDRSGDLSFHELMQVLKIMGLLPRTKEGQVQLMEKMKKADKDGSGSLDFMEFIQLMRRFSDEAECQEFDDEQRAALKSGFSDTEVAELQEVYDALRGEEDGDFTLSSARAFLRSLGVSCSSQQVVELKGHFDRFAVPTEPNEQNVGMSRSPKRSSKAIGNQQMALVLPFSKFLLFVGVLVSKDFAGLQAASSKLVANRAMEAESMEALMSQVSEAKQTRSSRRGSIEKRMSMKQGNVSPQEEL